ncbi:MAG: choice-of-anchor K domain-containing protein [Cyanobacteria bacterium P01_D01_bin.50]
MKLSLLFNIAVFPFALAALNIIGSPNQAKAAIFSGNVSGSWGKPTPGSINTNPFYTGKDTNTFSWGDPTLFENASSNQIKFEGNSFDASEGSLFKIGDLTYVNGTVLLGTSVESVPLKLDLSFTEPTEVSRVFDYEFYLQNTPNLSDDPELNADFVFVANNDAKRSFIYGGEEYTLSLTGFSQDNGKTNPSEFRVLEGEKTTAAIFAQINKVPKPKQVPEPGFPIALSVLGVYLIYRRKAKSSK